MRRCREQAHGGFEWFLLNDDGFDIILLDSRIVCHEGQPFNLALDNQHSVERIAVVRWKKMHCMSVF